MKAITLDQATLNVIRQISEPSEIVDVDGVPVAAIYPISPKADDEFRREIRELFDFEELERIRRTDRSPGRTTAEVLAHLRSLNAEQQP